jgi:hypothetical protein
MIAEPAAVTTSYTSGVAQYTTAGANSCADTMNKGNEGWESDSGTYPQMLGGDQPYGNNNHVARGYRCHNSDSIWGGRRSVCWIMFQHVGERCRYQIQFDS